MAQHKYVSANLGHSNSVCKWCHGTPAENAALGEFECSQAPADDDNEPPPSATGYTGGERRHGR